jgi:hypothetical protein
VKANSFEAEGDAQDANLAFAGSQALLRLVTTGSLGNIRLKVRLGSRFVKRRIRWPREKEKQVV